jgi:hypothetical protein
MGVGACAYVRDDMSLCDSMCGGRKVTLVFEGHTANRKQKTHARSPAVDLASSRDSRQLRRAHGDSTHQWL